IAAGSISTRVPEGRPLKKLTTPPRRTIARACCQVAGFPAASTTESGPRSSSVRVFTAITTLGVSVTLTAATAPKRRATSSGAALGGGGCRQRYGNTQCRDCRENPDGRRARSGFGGGGSRESRNLAAGSRDGPPRRCCQFLQRSAFGHARGNRARSDSLFGDQAHLAFPPYSQVLPRSSGSHPPRRHLGA